MPDANPPSSTTTTPPEPRTKTIAIFGSYHAPEASPAYRFAYELGSQLAHQGFEVLNGGYDGTMRAASKGARDAGGTTIGLTCPNVLKNASGPLQPNPYLNEILPAPDILTRIAAMMRLSGGYVVLDGGTGTLAELAVVWEFISKGFIPPRPIVLAGTSWHTLAQQMHNYRNASTKHLHCADTVEQTVAILTEHAVRGTRARNSYPNPTALCDATTTVAQLTDIMNDFVDQRDWHTFHDPKNLSASIAIEAAELMEHFQWLRSDQLDRICDDETKLAGIREELADILAYVLSFASTMNIDLSSALAAKMQKNALKYPIPQFRGKFEPD